MGFRSSHGITGRIRYVSEGFWELQVCFRGEGGDFMRVFRVDLNCSIELDSGSYDFRGFQKNFREVSVLHFRMFSDTFHVISEWFDDLLSGFRKSQWVTGDVECVLGGFRCIL